MESAQKPEVVRYMFSLHPHRSSRKGENLVGEVRMGYRDPKKVQY